MKQIRLLFYLLLLPFVFLACSTDKEEKQFCIQGVWELQSVTFYDEDVSQYPINGMTWMRIYDDSCYYECQIDVAPTGTMITPSNYEIYTFMKKGQDDVLYLQGDNTHPLIIENDSIMVIQEYGRKYRWKVLRDFEDERCKDIVGIIRDDVNDNADAAHHYVFSKAEKDLKADNNLLIYIIAGIVVVFLVFINHFYRVYQKKKRVEQELQRIEQERQALPVPVRKALDTVEAEFHQSEFYLSLRKRIAGGERLKKADWDVVEKQINSVYPGFTNRLMSLYEMSPVEYQVCLLLKLNATPSEIASVLCKDASSISSIRSRLYSKVFGKKGGSKE